jgi:NitT/TauT family transport system substrate-binding protein
VATYLARKSDIDAGMYADKKDWINAKWVLSSLPVNSLPGYVLANALTPAGLSVDDIQIEMVELPAQEEALRNGQVDIVYAVEPWITRMTAKGDIVILDSAERYAPELSSSLVIAGPRIIDDPDVGRRFAIAYLKAVRQYMEGPTPRNVELAVKLTGLAPELMEQICWSSSPVNGVVNTASLMDFQEWLLERGLIDELVSMEDIYEPAFAEYAVSVLGEVVP